LSEMDYDMQHIGKLLLLLGAIIAALGVLMMLSAKIPWIGRLPGDIVFQRKNFTFYFPLATSILISLLLTLLFWIFGRK
jgi:cell division protein FtsW (lipid II flippase)